ncbi:MAG: glycosyltransferase [Chloroflexota bacterium]
MKKSILLLIYEFVPLGDARIIRWANLSRYLADNNYDVSILTTEFSECDRSLDASLIDIVNHPNIEIHRIVQRSCHSTRPEIFSWLRKAYVAVRELTSKKSYDVLLSSALPIFPNLVASLVKRNRHIPLWFADYGDPWSTSRTIGQGPMKKFVEQILEREALRVADGLILTTPLAKDIFYPVYNRPDDIHIIPNGASYFHLSADWTSKHRILSEDDDLVILYTGSFYRTREPNKLFDGLSQVEHVHLHVVGRHRMDVETIAKDCNVQSKITLQPYTEQDRIVEMQQEADVLLLTSWPVPEQISGKIYEYLRTNKPILYVTDHEDDLAAQILREHDAAQYICPHQPEAIASMLSQIRNDAVHGNLPVRNPVHIHGFDSRADQLMQLIERSTV